MMIRYLIFGITYAFACAVQPGPFQAFIASQALSRGWKRTLPAAVAPLVSDGPILVITVLLLHQMPVWLEPVLFSAGGVFLIYLAVLTTKSWHETEPSIDSEETSHYDTLMKAALVNLLNPNPWLGWSLVMGPFLITGWRESPANGIALLASFYLTMIVVTAGLIILFAVAGKRSPRVNRVLLGLSALALGAFGCYALIRGLLLWF